MKHALSANQMLPGAQVEKIIALVTILKIDEIIF